MSFTSNHLFCKVKQNLPSIYLPVLNANHRPTHNTPTRRAPATYKTQRLNNDVRHVQLGPHRLNNDSVSSASHSTVASSQSQYPQLDTTIPPQPNFPHHQTTQDPRRPRLVPDPSLSILAPYNDYKHTHQYHENSKQLQLSSRTLRFPLATPIQGFRWHHGFRCFSTIPRSVSAYHIGFRVRQEAIHVQYESAVSWSWKLASLEREVQS